MNPTDKNYQEANSQQVEKAKGSFAAHSVTLQSKEKTGRVPRTPTAGRLGGWEKAKGGLGLEKSVTLIFQRYVILDAQRQ